MYAFFDGQSLFHAAKQAFGYNAPNYDPLQLAESISNAQGWQLDKVCFYTGIPDMRDNRFWHSFWSSKLAVMGTRGIEIFSRPLRYVEKTESGPGGQSMKVRVGREKGIDVRIALDIVKAARRNVFDVALVFSQDQDLSEVADEIREIAKLQDRWIKIASAFPFSPSLKNKRGINGTDWIKIDKTTYDACLDPHDYRPKK